MCGIAGIVRFDRPATASAAELRGLADRLAHRGPDGEGEAYASHAALAHRRLALLDAANGQQPWICPDRRFFLVYNGELRHPAGLHRSLADRWRFTSRCDTEVVLAAWRAWGPSCLERLDGMFAFFLWDDQEQVGWAVRDRLGIKPLVLLQGESTFAFASEAKALVPLLPQRPRANEWAVTEYLTAPCFSGVERPMFDGLSYLAPGQLLRIDRGGLEARRWWRYRLDPRPAEEGAQATAIRRRLQDAVHHALEADEALGIFLSGGLDSTLLAAMAVRAGHRLPAFTVRFAGQAEFDYATSRIVLADDSPFAGQAADAFGLQQTWVDVDRHRLGSTLRRLAIQNCALPAWEQEVAQDALARAARPQVKAVLVGDAADETHWGYHFLLDPTVTRGPAEILRRFAPAAAFSTGDAITRLDRHYRRLVAEDGWSWDDPRQRRLATASLIVHRWLPRLLHNGDVHTMAWGLEARVPFADLALLDVARRVEPELALRGGEEKALLRRAAQSLVPRAIRQRRKSALPKDQATTAIYRSALRPLLDEAAPWLARWLEIDRLRRLVCGSERLGENDRALLFRVLCLIHWARHYEVRGYPGALSSRNLSAPTLSSPTPSSPSRLDPLSGAQGPRVAVPSPAEA